MTSYAILLLTGDYEVVEGEERGRRRPGARGATVVASRPRDVRGGHQGPARVLRQVVRPVSVPHVWPGDQRELPRAGHGDPGPFAVQRPRLRWLARARPAPAPRPRARPSMVRERGEPGPVDGDVAERGVRDVRRVDVARRGGAPAAVERGGDGIGSNNRARRSPSTVRPSSSSSVAGCTRAERWCSTHCASRSATTTSSRSCGSGSRATTAARRRATTSDRWRPRSPDAISSAFFDAWLERAGPSRRLSGLKRVHDCEGVSRRARQRRSSVFRAVPHTRLGRSVRASARSASGGRPPAEVDACPAQRLRLPAARAVADPRERDEI